MGDEGTHSLLLRLIGKLPQADAIIVIGPDGIYNPGAALRFPDEFVRHKLLDFLGDLMLLGGIPRGKIMARGVGSKTNGVGSASVKAKRIGVR